MGLAYDRTNSVPRKPYYGNLDTSLRRNIQAAQLQIPIVQAQDNEEFMGAYTEYSKNDASSTNVTLRLYGQHTKIKNIQWKNNSANNWSYTININGFQIQSGTGSGATNYQDITTTDFIGKIFNPTDYVEINMVLTAGVGNVSPSLLIKGWNS